MATWKDTLTNMLPQDLKDAGFTLEEEEHLLVVRRHGEIAERYSAYGPTLEQVVANIRELMAKKPVEEPVTPPVKASVTVIDSTGKSITYEHYFLVGITEGSDTVGGLAKTDVGKHLSYNVTPPSLMLMLMAVLDLTRRIRETLTAAVDKLDPPTAG